MKLKKHILILLLLSLAGQAQVNLVPNPSFEIYSQCPYNQNQVPFATGWSSSGESPDYFNSCDNTVPDFSVPNNWGGYQVPASGNAYCGIGTYLSRKFAPEVREYIGVALSNTLTIGTKYFVSFKTSLAIDTAVGNCATNNLGALFTMTPLNIGAYYPGGITPQVNYANLITDTVNWTKVFGSFVADSSYQFIFVGNFYLDSTTDTLIINNNDTAVINGKNICYAYYYLDDVCVSTDSLYTLNWSWTNIKQFSNSGFKIFPNPCDELLEIEGIMTANYLVSICDLVGKELITLRHIGSQALKIDTQEIPSGIYFLKIKGDYEIIQKLIINH